MPANYWRDFGAGMPARAQVFWTGNQVCSASITCADIHGIETLLGRKPVLWDNYPVNDGEKACNFLHLDPLPGREPGLAQALSGHFCNPMNQADLSRYPLAGLSQLYGGPQPRWERYYGTGLGHLLKRDRDLFQREGLAGIEQGHRQALMVEYGRCRAPAAQEIVDWLSDGYCFDPACLTG